MAVDVMSATYGMFVKKIIGEQEKHAFVASKKDENPRWIYVGICMKRRTDHLIYFLSGFYFRESPTCRNPDKK
jgi:hypothetical protein